MTIFQLISYLPELEIIGCKRLSKNDISWAHPSGTHQYGILIPKIFVEKQIFPNLITTSENINKESIVVPLLIKWIINEKENLERESNFIYYPSKTEYRITRPPKEIFSKLSIEEENFLLIGKAENPIHKRNSEKTKKITDWIDDKPISIQIADRLFYYAEIISSSSKNFPDFIKSWKKDNEKSQGFILSNDLIVF